MLKILIQEDITNFDDCLQTMKDVSGPDLGLRTCLRPEHTKNDGT